MSQASHFGTILIVDDKERNIEVLGTTLAAMGYEIIPALSGEQALARLEARLPDLILLDILMPGMDGFEVCQRLKENKETVGIPVIFVSAADEKDVIVRALETGGVDYVTKPFNKSELRARVQTHLELKQARDQLHELVGQREALIGMLAHDLQNPLFGARVSARLLDKQSADLPETANELVTTVRDGIERAFECIDGCLARAAADRMDVELKMTEIDLCACLDTVLSHHTDHATGKNITLHLEKPDRAHWRSTDPTALSDALDNLISNALKFSPLGSKVWVELDTAGNSIYVRDEGPGFTDEDKERLFERFVRLSASPTAGETSTGMGLSIAKRLVELIGGELTCKSHPGEGAEFKITLPPDPN